MKKKLAILMVGVAMMSFIIGGCATNNKKQHEDHQGEVSEKKEETTLERLQKQLGDTQVEEIEVVDPEGVLQRVRDIYAGESAQPMVITTDGAVYKMSLHKMYSNNSNFERVDTEIKSHHFLERLDALAESYIVSQDQKLYHRSEMKVVEEYGVNRIESDFGGKITDYTNLAYMRGEDYGRDLIKLENGKLYLCETNEQLSGLPEDIVVETIFDDTIKANDGWYIREWYCTNQDDVDKYVDVEPHYDYKSVKVFDADVVYYKSWGGVSGCVIEEGKLYGVGNGFEFW